ncbi:MAG: bacteriophage abortive infection AbiH family protein [Campylobacterales bacterium]|nr:bacteriophage abortive infection AbiH family protein [Campylobacterales bacterium]
MLSSFTVSEAWEQGNKTLYIIGNGFDIHHGIKSDYLNFKHYLQEADSAIYNLIEEYISIEENWSDFEAALAKINVDSIIENTSDFLASYGADDWSDAYHHDYQYEVNRIVEGLSGSLKEHFGEWVRQLEIPDRVNLSIHPVHLNTDAQYLTFNYTSSLTDIYGIPESSILYIHGKAKNNEDLVLGHAWNPAEIPSLNDVPDSESMDTRVMEGNEIINSYFGSTFKDSKKIIAENANYFEDLSGLLDIYVLGHSLSSVDEVYFREIVANIDLTKVRWIVTYHTDKEREEHRKTLTNLGIEEDLILLCKMAELLVHPRYKRPRWEYP